MGMVEINREVFEGMPPEEQSKVLFDSICRMEPVVVAIKADMDKLLASPWRMAIPPVSWKYLGMFVIALALIIKGDVATAFRVLGALFGIM